MSCNVGRINKRTSVLYFFQASSLLYLHAFFYAMSIKAMSILFLTVATITLNGYGLGEVVRERGG